MDETNLEQLVETKLTKSELIDVLIEEMKVSNEKARQELQAEVDRLRASFTSDDILGMLRGLPVRIEPSGGGTNRKYFQVFFNASWEVSSFSPGVRERLERITELVAEQDRLSQQAYHLNEKRARGTILKTMLEGSEQGREFLRLLDGLKVKVNTKLLRP
jgi:hypothetical protein